MPAATISDAVARSFMTVFISSRGSLIHDTQPHCLRLEDFLVHEFNSYR
jgi:hypothetical protein